MRRGDVRGLEVDSHLLTHLDTDSIVLDIDELIGVAS